jgi:glucose-6-phosphate isomerase
MSGSTASSWKDSFLLTPTFENATAVKRLEELSTIAPDLRQPGVISEERVTSLRSEGAGLLLLYGFQRVDQEILRALQMLAEERQVVKQMQALFAGKPVNFIEGYSSENRPVLHPATRDVFEIGVTGDASAKRAVEQELSNLRMFFSELDPQFEHLIFIGIGGSELGPRALAESLLAYHLPNRHVHYVANVDPDDMTLALRQCNLKKTLVAVISKSGTTLETATNEARARNAFESKGLDPRHHFISVTMPQTPMDDPLKYKAVFHLFDFVGGRFSSTSMVGAVLLSFLVGVNNFFELLGGANEMDQVALRKDMRENLPLLLALLEVWNRNFLQYPTTAVIPYSRVLHRFPAHLQQCSMESNGKGINRSGLKVSFKTGPVIWGEPGTNAQHSFFQLLHQGTDVVPVEFIGFKESQFGEDFMYKGTNSQEKLVANMLAQSLALAVGKTDENPNKQFPGNRPSTLILAKRLDPRILGALLSLYEHKIAFEGFLWGINSFDQEGVQLGKVLADQIISVMKVRREGGENLAASPVGRRLLDIVEDLTASRGVVPKSG